MNKLSNAKKLNKIKEKSLKSITAFFKGLLNDFTKEVKENLCPTEVVSVKKTKKVSLKKLVSKKLGRKPRKQKELTKDEIK